MGSNKSPSEKETAKRVKHNMQDKKALISRGEELRRQTAAADILFCKSEANKIWGKEQPLINDTSLQEAYVERLKKNRDDVESRKELDKFDKQALRLALTAEIEEINEELGRKQKQVADLDRERLGIIEELRRARKRLNLEEDGSNDPKPE